jgi:putative nucleotidyltransferase with HDIG domain
LTSITTNPINKNYQLTQPQLENILKITRAVSGIFSTNKLLTKMASAIEETLSCTKCIVWLFDSNEDILWSYTGKKKITAGINHCLAGKAYEDQKFIHLANPGPKELFNDYTDSLNGASTGHILCFPFNQKDGAGGVIQIMNTSVHQITPVVINVINEWSSIAAGLLTTIIRTEDFKKAFDTFVDTISHAFDTRDFIAAGHSRRVTLYAVEVAKQMGLSALDTEILRYAGLLHDIGKIGVPELILLKDKKPTDDEFEIIKRHVGLTKNMLEKVHLPGDFKKIVGMAATHHERLDGNGYPSGLKGDEIPRGGKILAVCDVFDALTSRRSYEDRQPVRKVINILDNEINESFEPFIVYHFKNITLDRIIQIMEYGHSAHIKDEDLEYLKGFTLNDLVTTEKIKSDDQHKMESTFDKYYSRQYRN